MFGIIIGLLALLIMVVSSIYLYGLPAKLTKRDVILTSIPEGYIGGISNVQGDGAPHAFFSSTLKDGRRVSEEGKVFDPRTNTSLVFRDNIFDSRNIFFLGLPKYGVRSEFADPGLFQLQVKLKETQDGDQDKEYSISPYDPRTQNNRAFPERFTFAYIADNVELPDGSKIDIYVTVGCHVDDMKQVNASIANGQLGKITQSAPAGKTNDFIKDGRFKKYEDVQEWKSNSDLDGATNDLFEQLKMLNENLPGHAEGFKGVLGIEIDFIIVEGMEGGNAIAEAALQDAIAREEGKAKITAAKANAKVKDISSKADTRAIGREGDERNRIREGSVAALGKNPRIAEAHALSELDLTTYVAPGGHAHPALDLSGGSKPSKTSDKDHDGEEKDGGKK